MGFWDKLEQSIRQRDSLLCVGLDPWPDRIPSRYETVGDFNRAIIDATVDLACAYKPNMAFYEALGSEGFRALRETLDCIPEETPVLLDAKRNDIAAQRTRRYRRRWIKCMRIGIKPVARAIPAITG